MHSNKQYATIGAENGLAPTRRQANILIHYVHAHLRIYGSIGLNELTNDV